jgi:hypothetical protein
MTPIRSTSSDGRSDLQPAVGWLFDRSGAMGSVLEYGAAYLFVENSSFANRLRTALELTSHAESASNTTVVLSLYVSALEALLCSEDKKAKNSEQLKRRIPALLHANRLAGDTEDALRSLYKVRNRCMHGQDVSTSKDVSAVQLLFAAVFRATLEWSVHNYSSAESADDRHWIKALKSAVNDSDRIFAGITKELSEYLHAFTAVFGKDRLAAEWPEVTGADD